MPSLYLDGTLHAVVGCPRLALVCVLVVAASCVGDRAPSHATPVAPRQADSPSLASSSGATDAGESDTSPSIAALDSGSNGADAGADGSLAQADARAADASATLPPLPLVLQGVRKCSAEEAADEYCSEGKLRGMCLDGYCVTETSCPRYCAASAARDHKDCVPGFDVKECMGVPECLKVRKDALAICSKLRTDLETNCLRVMCATIRTLPPP